MPYWDWAIVTGQGQGVLPLSVQSPQVEVISATSGGKRVPMDNPLYSFHFDPLNPTEGDFPDDSQVSIKLSLLLVLCLCAILPHRPGLCLHARKTLTDRLSVQWMGIDCPLAKERYRNLAEQLG